MQHTAMWLQCGAKGWLGEIENFQLRRAPFGSAQGKIRGTQKARGNYTDRCSCVRATWGRWDLFRQAVPPALPSPSPPTVSVGTNTAQLNVEIYPFIQARVKLWHCPGFFYSRPRRRCATPTSAKNYISLFWVLSTYYLRSGAEAASRLAAPVE